MVQVPDVVGMSVSGAREYLKREELEYRLAGSRASEDTAAGKVLSQEPPAGLMVAPATVVKLVLSIGPRQVVVPSVTEMSVPQAKRNLEAAGLVSGEVREAYQERIPAGYVASTFPAANAKVVPGTQVDMVVSLGPQPTMPPGPPLPGSPEVQAGREETLVYSVPTDAGPRPLAKVVVELTDQSGRQVIYEGFHKPGESIPPQKIRIANPATVRILVNGETRWQRQYLP